MGQTVVDIVTPLVSSPVLENEVISRLGITPGRIEYTFASGERPTPREGISAPIYQQKHAFTCLAGV
jgi:hypothetical protein